MSTFTLTPHAVFIFKWCIAISIFYSAQAISVNFPNLRKPWQLTAFQACFAFIFLNWLLFVILAAFQSSITGSESGTAWLLDFYTSAIGAAFLVSIFLPVAISSLVKHYLPRFRDGLLKSLVVPAFLFLVYAALTIFLAYLVLLVTSPSPGIPN